MLNINVDFHLTIGSWWFIKCLPVLRSIYIMHFFGNCIMFRPTECLYCTHLWVELLCGTLLYIVLLMLCMSLRTVLASMSLTHTHCWPLCLNTCSLVQLWVCWRRWRMAQLMDLNTCIFLPQYNLSWWQMGHSYTLSTFMFHTSAMKV